MRTSRHAGLALALLAAVTLAASAADARPGGGFSSGSRGSRSFSAPPATATAPRAPQNFQRTETRPNVGAPQASAARPSFGRGLFAGLLGAGLLGMLFGSGFFGGLSGLASILGLLFQAALVVGLVMLAMRFFRRRQEPALAGMSRDALNPGTPAYQGNTGGAARGPAPGARTDDVGIGPADYAAFEQRLTEIQNAYGREDIATLRRAATPEMARYFEQDLAENARKGLINRVSAPSLIQGDLAESWREGPVAYATVAMRYALIDAMVERQSGRVVSGSLTEPDEAVEIWTFRREGAGPWILSAIQQTA